MKMMNERFEHAMKEMHLSHFAQKARLAKAEKRALKLIRLSRNVPKHPNTGYKLNTTELQHIQRYMDRRKKMDESVAKALEVKD